MKKWRAGFLKEAFGPLPAGQSVYFRRMVTSRPLAVGECFWIRPATKQFGNQFFSVAITYGGVDMRSLIRTVNAPLKLEDDVHIRLNHYLREFCSQLPAGAVVSPIPRSQRPTRLSNQLRSKS